MRINGCGTPWHADDLASVGKLALSAVVLPKAEDVGDVVAVVQALGGKVSVVALIETAAGLASARAIADIDGVERLTFGSVDFCADLGCDHLREVLLPAWFEIVLASKLARIAPPIDGVTTALDDPTLCEADARHARNLGMSGKLCIHPKQISAVKQAFRPSDEGVDWARRVLEASEEAAEGEEDGAVSLDGVMIDKPVRLRARAILASLD